MRVFKKQYLLNKGWDNNQFPNINQNNAIIFIFAAPDFFDHKAIPDLMTMYPNAHFFGCSSAGEIFGNRVFDQSLSVAIAELENVGVKTFEESVSAFQSSKELGLSLGKKLNSKTNLSAVMILSDGLSVNGSELSAGLSSALPKNVIVTGGLAGDGDRFKKTWVLTKNGPQGGKVVVVGFYGNNIVFTHGSQGGWDFFGPERKVTKSKGNILFELDGEPALDLYKKYLGEKSKELPSSALLFPLQIVSESNDNKSLVRTILSVDHELKSMTFAGDIPQGCNVQLMRANFDRLIDGASGAANAASVDQNDKNCEILSIAISCVGRRLVLGERIEEEVEETLAAFPPNTVQIGFYSYGELSPLVKDKPCELHNQTMTLTAISENGVK